MMELNHKDSNLEFLIGSAWDLHDRINTEVINQNKTSTCCPCRVRAQRTTSCCCCWNACVSPGNKSLLAGEADETFFLTSLIGIRDSIRDVGNMLSSLQRLSLRQTLRREEAIARLEESRLKLMELMKRHRSVETKRIGASSLLIEDLSMSFDQDLKRIGNVAVAADQISSGRWKSEVVIVKHPTIIGWLIRDAIVNPFLRWKTKKAAATAALWISAAATAARLVVLQYCSLFRRRYVFESREEETGHQRKRIFAKPKSGN